MHSRMPIKKQSLSIKFNCDRNNTFVFYTRFDRIHSSQLFITFNFVSEYLNFDNKNLSIDVSLHIGSFLLFYFILKKF